MPSAAPALPAPSSAVHSDPIRARLEALPVGAIAHVAGLRVERVSLFAFDCGGYILSLEDAIGDLPVLAAERGAIALEPSLTRATEIAVINLRNRGIHGAFSLRNGGRCAAWSTSFGNNTRADREALEALASVCNGLGVGASRVGFEVWASGRIHLSSLPEAA